MANCEVDGWKNKNSDSFCQWKEEYAHRVFCDMLTGDCDLHDTSEAIAKHQKQLKTKIERYEKELVILKYMQKKHQDKWGIQHG